MMKLSMLCLYCHQCQCESSSRYEGQERMEDHGVAAKLTSKIMMYY